MPASPDLDALAAQMKAAQDGAAYLEPFSGRVPGFDVAAAYAVADRVHRARLREGARPVGRKIGFTNPDMWDRFGVREPIWAYLYDTTVVRLDGTRAACSLSRFVEPRIEPEIVFGFRAAPRGGPEDILQAIEWVAHGFEIVQSHFPGWRFTAADTVADWALHATLLVGPPQPLDRFGPDVLAMLERFTLTLSCDGRAVETARGANVLGNPVKAVAHLVEVLARQPDARPLQAGEIVTTGTITTAWPLRAGEVWTSALEGIALPGLSVGCHA